jgi:hypothetical protein
MATQDDGMFKGNEGGPQSSPKVEKSKPAPLMKQNQRGRHPVPAICGYLTPAPAGPGLR